MGNWAGKRMDSSAKARRSSCLVDVAALPTTASIYLSIDYCRNTSRHKAWGRKATGPDGIQQGLDKFMAKKKKKAVEDY